MIAYRRVDGLIGHLLADCLYTGISSETSMGEFYLVNAVRIWRIVKLSYRGAAYDDEASVHFDSTLGGPMQTDLAAVFLNI